MIIGMFENGYSVSQSLTGKFLTVEQAASNHFVIKNAQGEIIMSNFHEAEKACKVALESCTRYYEAKRCNA